MSRTAPVFLVAAERSGSTMMRLMLAHHPRIAFAGEFDFLVDAISPDGKFLKRDAFVRAAEANRVFRHQQLTIPQTGNFAEIARNFMAQVQASKADASIRGAMLHRHFDRILWLWPDARFIHLVRDGRDVALSTIAMGWAGNMWQGIRNWVDVETLWQRLSQKLPPDRQISVKYEALVSDPHSELRRITDFLGLDFDPAMLDYPLHSTYNAPFTSSIGRWRKAAIAHVQAAEHRGARWLLQNGYLLSGTLRPPSAVRRLALRLQDRRAIAAHRRAMLGNGLWLKMAIVKRIGSQKAKARIDRLQDEIIEATLK